MRNESLHDWVQTIAMHTQPARIHYCDGTELEHAALIRGKFTTRLPSGLLSEHQLLMARLSRALT